MSKLMLKRVWGSSDSPIAKQAEFVFYDLENQSYTMDKEDIIKNIEVLQQALVYFEDFGDDDGDEIPLHGFRF